MKTFRQPLVLHFIWHPDDTEKVALFVRGIRKMLARDVDRPFSRELNIPVFFWNKIDKDIFAEGSPYYGEMTIVFPFVSSNTKGCDDWKSFYERLPCKGRVFCVIPISIEKGLFHSKGVMNDLNGIRAFEWDKKDSKCKELLFDIAVAHNIYSFCYTKKNASHVGSELKLFLSHCKKGCFGEQLAKKIKAYVVAETTIKPFFDKTDIIPGEEFSPKIFKSIDYATLVIFETDWYSTSHWCQKEVVRAKNAMRPIISVDFRTNFEDRVFPGCSNVPCVHVRHNILSIQQNKAEIEYLRILEAALTETLRCHYNYSRLLALKKAGHIPSSAKLLMRPPELSDFKTDSKLMNRTPIVFYPDPPVFPEESDWYSKGVLDAHTPLWSNQNADEFKGLRCLISVSVPNEDDLGELLQVGHTPDSLQRLIQDVSRYLLVRGAKLLYGGNMQEKNKRGFTRFILDEAKALRDRGIGRFPKIVNHLAWPWSIDNEKLRRFKADNDSVLTVKRYPFPVQSKENVDVNTFLKPNTPRNRFIWAMSLSTVRKALINQYDVRICAGGKRIGYHGAMPGVLEEVLLALKTNKPLYLLGGFGGIVQDIVAAICQDSSPTALTEEWQRNHTRGYGEVLRRLAQNGHAISYSQIVELLQATSVKDLARRAGLSIKDYSRLMHSPFVDECLFLLLKGIRKTTTTTPKGTR